MTTTTDVAATNLVLRRSVAAVETRIAQARALLAEIASYDEAALQAVGSDLAVALAQGRIRSDLARGLDMISNTHS